jgi:hypothetical protein
MVRPSSFCSDLKMEHVSDRPKSQRLAWFRRHPRWTGFGLSVVLLLVVCAGAFLWIVVPFGSHYVAETTAMPVAYDEDRFFVKPVTTRGARLSLLTDTGGGLFLTAAAVERCGLATSWSIGRATVARLDPLRPDAWIPEPVGSAKWIPVWDQEGDGMLGQRWFAGGIWTFDYPRKKLLLSSVPFHPSSEQAAHRVSLGFPTFCGLRSGNHPRFSVTIDGQTVESLFDTGATVRLTTEALKRIGDGRSNERATSFAAASHFDCWHRNHPEWPFIENAEEKTQLAIIEVPRIQVAGFEVGPAWFTRRPDSAHQWMSTFMDRPIVASIGGSVLRNFRVTVDYPGAAAYFERPAK